MPKIPSPALHLADALAAIEAWHANLPAAERKRSYRPGAICRAAQVAPRHLPTAAGLLEWHRRAHWARQDGRRVFRTYYAPPGQRIAPPARGRPPQTLWDLFGAGRR